MPPEKKSVSAETNASLQKPASPLAGVLSLMVPGFGQIYQGRIGKGILFFACIYTLFFYGFALGKGKNVILPETSHISNPWDLPEFPADLYNRPQYVAQFFVGVVAWPALWQYRDGNTGETAFGDFERAPDEEELNNLQRSADKSLDLGWVMTVIAGALNVLVVYDAVSGPAFAGPSAEAKKEIDDESANEEKESR